MLCLAAGDYGQLDVEATKPGERLVIRPQDGATATMRFFMMRGGNITFQGLRIAGIGSMDGGTWRNVTWRASTFTGPADIRAASFNQNNVLFDDNLHIGARSGAAIRLPVLGANPTGITIQDSTFHGGTADGIQSGANGLTIVGNRFLDIYQDDAVCSTCHTDAIQLVGGKGHVIRANYFRNVSVMVGAFDGGERHVIEDNVGIDVGSVNALVIGSDDSSIIRHNTVDGTACGWSGNCGWVRLGSKASADPGNDTIVRNNIASKLEAEISIRTNVDHNMWFAGGGLRGPNDVTARPVFECGCSPATYEQAKLSPVSPGYRSASDGLDRGARIP